MKLSLEIRHKIAMWLIPVYTACFIIGLIISGILFIVAGFVIFAVDFCFGLSQLDGISDATEETKGEK